MASLQTISDRRHLGVQNSTSHELLNFIPDLLMNNIGLRNSPRRIPYDTSILDSFQKNNKKDVFFHNLPVRRFLKIKHSPLASTNVFMRKKY